MTYEADVSASDRRDLSGWRRSVDKWLVSQYGGSQEDYDKYEIQPRNSYIPNLFEIVVSVPLLYGLYHLVF